jgi:hypothetical protein
VELDLRTSATEGGVWRRSADLVRRRGDFGVLEELGNDGKVAVIEIAHADAASETTRADVRYERRRARNGGCRAHPAALTASICAQTVLMSERARRGKWMK